MRIIILSSHPDDEALGCGGTLLKHHANGDELYWVIVTTAFENQNYSKKWITSRQREIEEVKKKAGFIKVFKLDYPTATLDSGSLKTLVPALAKIFSDVSPEIIYLPNRSDAHSDHRITFEAAMACAKSFRLPSLKKILMYECISETEFAPPLTENIFVPNYFTDISEFMEKKIELAKIYKSELGEHPFPRSIENIRALATFRGAMAGVKYAEAFQVVKIIDK